MSLVCIESRLVSLIKGVVIYIYSIVFGMFPLLSYAITSKRNDPNTDR